MFQRILIPLDVAQKNQPALSAATELARERKATMLVLHVIERIEDVPEVNALGAEGSGNDAVVAVWTGLLSNGS